MQEVSITIEEVRRAGVTVPVSSRSYTLWIKHLAPALLRKGVTQTAIDRGRSACHVQHTDDGYLLKFHDTDDGVKRDAAQRSAAAALMEDQQRLLGKKTGNLPVKVAAVVAAPIVAPEPPVIVATETPKAVTKAPPPKARANAKAARA